MKVYIVLLVVLLSACSTSLDSDLAEELKVIQFKDGRPGDSFILDDSHPANKVFREWYSANRTGWVSSTEKHIPVVVIASGNYAFSVTDNLVILNVIEHLDYAKQYSKKTKLNELVQIVALATTQNKGKHADK